MLDLDSFREEFREQMLDRAKIMAQKISQYSFIESAILVDDNISIKWKEEVDTSGQDVLDVFIRGGVVKKVASKDKKEGEEKDEEDFILIEPIGEF